MFLNGLCVIHLQTLYRGSDMGTDKHNPSVWPEIFVVKNAHNDMRSGRRLGHEKHPGTKVLIKSISNCHN